MTKTLTKQWREGTLKGGFYYLEMNDGLVVVDHTIYVVGEKIYRWELSSIDYVKEVLEHVPSYDKVKEMSKKIERLEFVNDVLETAHNDCKKTNDELVSKVDKLEKKLEIATKALKRIDPPNIIFDDYRNSGIELWEIAHNALKEMEGVK